MIGEVRRLRVGTPSDWPAMAELYRVSALELGRLAYSDEQVRVWAGLLMMKRRSGGN